jgi:hypothetical protein
MSTRLDRLALALVVEADRQGFSIDMRAAQQLLKERMSGLASLLGITEQTVQRTYITEEVVREMATRIVLDASRREDRDNEDFAGLMLDRDSSLNLVMLLARGVAAISRSGANAGIPPSTDVITAVARSLIGREAVLLTGAGTSRLLAALECVAGVDIDISGLARAVLENAKAQREESRDGQPRELMVAPFM